MERSAQKGLQSRPARWLHGCSSGRNMSFGSIFHLSGSEISKRCTRIYIRESAPCSSRARRDMCSKATTTMMMMLYIHTHSHAVWYPSAQWANITQAARSAEKPLAHISLPSRISPPCPQQAVCKLWYFYIHLWTQSTMGTMLIQFVTYRVCLWYMYQNVACLYVKRPTCLANLIIIFWKWILASDLLIRFYAHIFLSFRPKFHPCCAKLNWSNLNRIQ